MRLVLVRHGQTSSNVDRLLDTRIPGPPLTPLGEQQAAALVDTLADEKVTSVWASTMLRTQLTAAPLAERLGLEVQVRDGLREITAGAYEMLGDDASVGAYLATVFAWSDGEVDRRMPGGEDGVEFFRRVDAVVAEAAERTERLGGTPVLFAHGATIRSWVAGRADNVDAAFARHYGLGNTGVVVLDGEPGGDWRVLSWTDAVVGELTPTDGPTGEPA